MGESETVKKKPAPDSVIEALKELGASAEKALYVGDSEVDIETAKNAGLTGRRRHLGFSGQKSTGRRRSGFYHRHAPWSCLS